MNHPKGEESTRRGEPCSSRTTCPQKLCSAAEQAPTNAALRPGRTFIERSLCGGLRSFFVGGTCGSTTTVTAARPGKARPCCVSLGGRRLFSGSAARDCFAIARRIGSPPGKAASPALPSGFCGFGGEGEARLVLFVR